ncbi:MAG: hypothetical protein R6U64_06240 [Bacteroidales bacterium]
MDDRRNYASRNSRHNNKNDTGFNIGPVIFLSVVSLILAVAVALVLRQMVDYRNLYEQTLTQKTMVADERDALLYQLNQLDEAFNELIQKNEGMMVLLEQDRQEIASLRRLISREMSPGMIAHYKERIQELEEQLNDYQQELQVLRTENQALQGENAQIRTALSQTAAEKQRLEEVQHELEEKVDQAQVIRISNLEVTPLRNRRRGDRSTARASRVDKLQFCFVVNENRVAQPGPKEFYFRVAGPDDQVMDGHEVDVLEYQGQRVQYSFEHAIDFQNEETKVCPQWQYTGFEPGSYQVTIYNQGEQVGFARFELK